MKETERADVIYETMRQILAARAIHNIFRMTESHLLVTCDCLKCVRACVCEEWFCVWVCVCVKARHAGLGQCV